MCKLTSIHPSPFCTFEGSASNDNKKITKCTDCLMRNKTGCAAAAAAHARGRAGPPAAIRVAR
jgi:hypothetical protein